MINELKNWIVNQPLVIWLLAGLAILLIFILLIGFKHRYHYSKKSHLASRSEQKLYKNLLLLLPTDYMIHCQVSLISLLKPADLKSARMVWAKRMDYVITDKNTKILIVIELDDKSHQRKDRIKRDKFVNKALAGKHTLLRLTPEQAQDINLLRQKLQSAINNSLAD